MSLLFFNIAVLLLLVTLFYLPKCMYFICMCDIIQLLTIEALDMVNVDLRVLILTEAEPRSILVFSGRHHTMSKA